MLRRLFRERSSSSVGELENEPQSQGASVVTSEEVYYNAARHFLDVQFATMDVLDTKTWQSLSVGSTVLTVTFALLNISTKAVPTAAVWSLGTALFFYGLLLFFSFKATHIRALEYRPDIDTLRENSETTIGLFLQQWVSNEHLASIQENKDLLVKKARWVGATQYALHVEAGVLAVAALLTIIAPENRSADRTTLLEFIGL